MRHPFRRKNFRLRLLPVYLLAVGVFALARPTPVGFAIGGALVAGGLALRAWGAGHLVKTNRLTVTGPYAHLRHPLYAGTLLVAAGFGAIAGGPGLLLLAVAFLPTFFGYYLPYKERVESERLEARYGDAYAAYRRDVPALMPQCAAWTPPADFPVAPRRWSRSCYRDNDEFGTLVATLLGLCLFALRTALPL